MICDHPYAVDLFFSTACRDKHAFIGKILHGSETIDDLLYDFDRLCHTSFSDVAASQKPNRTVAKHCASLAQSAYILLRCFVLVHIAVHRGAYKFLRVRCKIRGGEHIVGNALRKFCNDVCGCRRDNQNIRFFCKGYMVDVKLFDRFESVCYHCGFCKRLKRQRRDEFTSVVGHNNVNVCSEFFEPRYDFARFVHGNSAAYTQNHVFSVKHNNLAFNRERR